jgi:hypothetical protein
MTRLTRNAATQVFVTVMTNILGVETNSPLSLALFQVGVQDILDLIGLNFASEPSARLLVTDTTAAGASS